MIKTWYTIFVTSAFECPWCIKAKELLQVYGIDYYEKDIHTNDTAKEEFKAAGHRTVPQIYREDVLIGGHDALKIHLRNTLQKVKQEQEIERKVQF